MRDRYQYQPANQGTKPFWRNLSLVVTGGFLVVLAFALIGVWRMGDRFFSNVGAIFSLKVESPEVDLRPIVISQIRGASELTTSIFVMETVVPTRQNLLLGSVTLGTTKLLYIAHGEVRAGVDLGAIAPEDVTLTQDSITIQLPPPKILDRKIDVNRSSIYEYDRGFLGLGPDVGPNLQAIAQQETLKRIEKAACDNGILAAANQRAELVVGQLVKLTGYAKVTVKTQAPDPNTCGS
jgi:Protein of unknown function (DUF4230)